MSYGNVYVFYVDIYFIWNYVIKLTVLLLVLFSFGKRVSVPIYQVLLLIGIETVLEIIGLYISPNYFLFVLTVHLLLMPSVMVVLLWKYRLLIKKAVVRGYLFTVIINGVIEIFWNHLGNQVSYVVLILLGCGCGMLVVLYYFYIKHVEKGVYTVVLSKAGKSMEIQGLYDSGNRLKDPYTSKGVHIIAKSCITNMISNELQTVCIPYQSLGVSLDLMEVTYFDELIIYTQKEVIKQQKVPIGIAKEEMFFNKSYKMILNEEVF